MSIFSVTDRIMRKPKNIYETIRCDGIINRTDNLRQMIYHIRGGDKPPPYEVIDRIISIHSHKFHTTKIIKPLAKPVKI